MNRHTIRPLAFGLPGVCLLVVATHLPAQVATMSIGSGSGVADSQVVIPITVSIDTAADAFSLGVLHRSTAIAPIAVVEGSSVAALVDPTVSDTTPNGADFFSVDLSPVLPGGDPTVVGGWTLGIVFDFDLNTANPGEELVRLPANTPGTPTHELAVATYQIAVDAVAGVLPLEATAALGDPPVELLAVLTDGVNPVEVTMGTTNGAITVLNDPFVRGDLNDDGSVSLLDGILLLYRMFGLQPAGSCDDAEDINNDETKSLADPLFLFEYLFASGPAPANVGLCTDDTGPAGALGCVFSACIP